MTLSRFSRHTGKYVNRDSRMVWSQTASSSSIWRNTTSFLWVPACSAGVSSNSNTFWIIWLSSGRMVPCSRPSANIMRISSSVTTSSSSSGSTPRSLKIWLVEKVKSHTTGLQSFQTPNSMPDMPKAMESGFFMAIRLGTSSPNTRLK